MFAPTPAHNCWKTLVEPVKWIPASSGWASTTSEISGPTPGQHVDHPGRQAGLVQQVHDQRRGQLLGGRRLPHHHVAHQRRRRRQVPGDGGEVERRDGVDEALQRPVIGAVPDALGVGDRLLGQDLPGEVHVEPPEVGELAGRVDLRLVGGLGLAEHGRGVDPGPPRPGQQVGGAQQDRRAGIEVQRPPAGGRVQRGRDGLGGVGLGASSPRSPASAGGRTGRRPRRARRTGAVLTPPMTRPARPAR